MDRLRLEVGAPAHGGHCVARHDGRVVFVRHAVPGEVVTAEVTEGGESARFWRADAVEIHEPSPDRVDSVWPEAGPGGVGGGELAHVALPAQRAWKLEVLRDAFRRFAGPTHAVGLFPGGTVCAAPGDDERGGLRSRTRVAAVAGPDGRASMRRFRSHEVLPLTAMPLATEAAEEALLAGRYPEGATVDVVDASDEERVRVLVNGVPWTGKGADRRPNAPTHVREVVTPLRPADATSSSRAGAAADVSPPAAGPVEYCYRVRATGFWQVHREAPAVLVGEVLARVGGAPRVLDLYAGAGLFTLPLAASGRDVVSVESDEGAAKDARRNLHAHPSATVVHGDVRATLREGVGRFDAVVLDPPRSGAGRATLEALAATEAATVVYVACDPVALARDVAILRDLGYELESATAWDLFPMTHHVETVATFRR